MTTENQAPDPYDAVIADLRAQRDQIDQTISLLTTLRNGGRATVAPPTPAPDSGIVETAGMFLGMSIVDAAKKLLAMRKRTMGNVEIAREIQAGGLVLTGKDPVNVVGSVLTRRFNDAGDVVKVGRGIWGLKEWYPGRNFKVANKVNAEVGASTDTTGSISAGDITKSVAAASFTEESLQNDPAGSAAANQIDDPLSPFLGHRNF